jgi:hypothetical protein
MPTKKPSSKKAAKKSSNSTKRSTKKNKNNAAEITDATENKELQTLVTQADITPVVDNINNTTEAAAVSETVQVDITTSSTEQTPDTSSLESSAAAIHKDEVVVESASYNNMVVPQTKDNTYAFIIGGFVFILTLMLFFL